MPRKKENIILQNNLPDLTEENVQIKIESSSDTSTASSTDENEWSKDIEKLLDNIRENCSVMSKYHKRRYLLLKNRLIYFRIPLIVIGSVNSVFAVGLTTYLEQKEVSTINCILSLVCAIITSTELYLGISNSMEKELISQRDFYLLAVDIFTILALERKHRSINGRKYLDKTLTNYNKYIENGDIIRNKMKDKLLPINNPTEDPDNQIVGDINVDPAKKNLTSIIYGDNQL